MTDWFQQTGINVIALHAVDFPPMADRGQHDEYNLAKSRFSLDHSRKSGTVEPRHLIVGNYDMKRVLGRLFDADGRERFFSCGVASVSNAPARNLLMQNAPVHGIVVNDQDAQSAQTGEGNLHYRR